MYTVRELLERRNEIQAASAAVSDRLAVIEEIKLGADPMAIDNIDTEETSLRERKKALDDLHRHLNLVEEGTVINNLVNLIFSGWLMDSSIEKENLKKVVTLRKVNKLIALKQPLDSHTWSHIQHMVNYIFNPLLFEPPFKYKEFIAKFTQNLVELVQASDGKKALLPNDDQFLAENCKMWMNEVKNSYFFSSAPENQVTEYGSTTLEKWLENNVNVVVTVNINNGAVTERRLSTRLRMMLRQILDELRVVHGFDIGHGNLKGITVRADESLIIPPPIYDDKAVSQAKDDFQYLKSLLIKAVPVGQRPRDMQSFLDSLDVDKHASMKYYHPLLWSAEDMSYLVQAFVSIYEDKKYQVSVICWSIPVHEFFTIVPNRTPYKELYKGEGDPSFQSRSRYFNLPGEISPLIYKRDVFWHMYKHLANCDVKKADDYAFAICPDYMSLFMASASAIVAAAAPAAAAPAAAAAAINPILEAQSILGTVKDYFLGRHELKAGLYTA